MADETIHEVVRDRYGAIARSVNSTSQQQADTCCGDTASDCCSSSSLYDMTMLEGLPLDVTGLSLGCGDPVSIANLNPGETVLDLGSGGGIDCFLASRQVGETGHVIGVDMTPQMISKAALREDVQVAGLSILSGARITSSSSRRSSML